MNVEFESNGSVLRTADISIKLTILSLPSANEVFTSMCQEFCPQGDVSQHALGQTPPGRYTPWAGTPPGRYTPWAGTPPGRYTSWAGTPPGRSPWQVHPLPSQVPPGQVHSRRAGTPPPQGHCSGRYTSYWECILVDFCWHALSAPEQIQNA